MQEDTGSGGLHNSVLACQRTPKQWSAHGSLGGMWLNIKADLAAKNCIMDSTQDAKYNKLPFETWYLVINNMKVIKQQQQAIRAAMNGPVAQQYWREKMLAVSQPHTALDLPAMEQALSKSTPG